MHSVYPRGSLVFKLGWATLTTKAYKGTTTVQQTILTKHLASSIAIHMLYNETILHVYCCVVGIPLFWLATLMVGMLPLVARFR
jgi:hypothetical protein